MHNDESGDRPSPSAPGSDTPPEGPDAKSPLLITRRELLKYGGSLAALPLGSRLALGQRAVAIPSVLAAVTQNLKVRVVRARDMLDLTFEFFNLKLLKRGEGGPGDPATNRLVRKLPTRPGFVVVHFQPQSIGEEAFWETSDDPHPDPTDPGGTEPLPAPPVHALLAAPSRLAFRVPDNMVAIPYRFDELLTWGQWGPFVVPAARKNATQVRPPIRAPLNNETSIEAPWRLLLSTSELSKWSHAKEPVTHHGRTELWHTRARDFIPGTQASAEEDLADPAVGQAHFANASLRAVWTPGFDPTEQEPSSNDIGPFRTSLTPRRRYELVRLTSDWHLVKKQGGGTYNPKPATADLFMLTALGAWVDLEGNWPIVKTPATGGGLDPWESKVIEWQHHATQARDNFVKVVEQGCLFPIGFEAVLITITERKLQPVDDPGAPLSWKNKTGAFLRQRAFILVTNPLRTFNATTPRMPFGGKKFPFKQVVCLTKMTPNLRQFDGPSADDASKIIDSDTNDPYGSDEFWPQVDGADPGPTDFLFNVRVTDIFGQESDYTTPLAFLSEPKCDDEHAIEDAIASLANGPSSRRTRLLQGQKVAFAKFTGGKVGDTTYPVESMTFAGVKATPFGDPGAGPSYYPEMVSAKVTVDQAEHVKGTGLDKPTIVLHKAWYDPANNPGNGANVFAYLADPNNLSQEKALDLTFGADRSGGVITPNMAIAALSSKTGPFGGANIADGVPTQFDPQDFFSGLADDKLPKLLGGLNLWDIVATIGGFGANDLEKIPKLLQTPLPNELVTEFVWRPTPQEDSGGGFHPIFEPQGGCVIELGARIVTKLNDGLPTGESKFEVFGQITNFRVNLLGKDTPSTDGFQVLALPVDRIAFTSVNGAKPDLAFEMGGTEFLGAFEFLAKLAEFLDTVGGAGGAVPSQPGAAGGGGGDDGGGLDIVVDESGISAGFTLEIPSIVIGVCSVENISFGLHVLIPWIGEPASLEVNFCTQERPFILTVMGLGGGGFAELVLTLEGFHSLLIGLQAQAQLALDFGVASGKIAASLGITFLIEASGKVTITAFFRLVGEVDVLGLITASIELYIGFSYSTPPPLLCGQASVTVEVDVFVFSGSVTIGPIEKCVEGGGGGGGAAPALASGRARVASGDTNPVSFADTMTPGDWTEYTQMFATASVAG